MNPTLDPFQDALLAELRGVVEDNASADAAPAPEPARPSRRRWLLTAAAIGGVAGAVGLVPLVAGPDPAYAVTGSAGGTVDVKVDRLKDAAGLQAALERAGVKADVQYLPEDTVCADGRFRVAVPPDAEADAMISFGTSGYHVELAPGAIGKDQTLVISMARISDGKDTRAGVTGSVGVAEGPVAACRQVPAPPPPDESPRGRRSRPGRCSEGRERRR